MPMSDAPRFEHRVLSSGEHCVTSPDIRGLCAVAPTEAESRQGAVALLARCVRLSLPIRPRSGSPKHEAP